MCRMIAFASDSPRDLAPLLEGLVRLSRDGRLVDGWERRPGGNHPDGWGIAYRGEEGMKVLRGGRPAGEDPALARLARCSDRFLGHVRYASNIATVGAANSHPFVVGDRLLAHNGTFYGKIGADADRRGVSDTLVFLELLAATLPRQTLPALAQTLSRLLSDRELVGNYSAANFLVGLGDTLFALRKYRRHPDYYTLHLFAEEGAVTVASEPLDRRRGWRPLGDGELVELSPSGPASARVEAS